MGKAYSLRVSLLLVEANLKTWLSLELGKHLVFQAENVFLGIAEEGLVSQVSSGTSKYLATLGNIEEREAKEHRSPCFELPVKFDCCPILGECSGQFLSFPVSTIPEDKLGYKEWDMSACSPTELLCHPHFCCYLHCPENTNSCCTCIVGRITNVLFTALTGLSDVSLSIWLIFPSAADSSFYTKIIE